MILVSAALVALQILVDVVALFGVLDFVADVVRSASSSRALSGGPPLPRLGRQGTRACGVCFAGASGLPSSRRCLRGTGDGSPAVGGRLGAAVGVPDAAGGGEPVAAAARGD